jgi:hypothetical protein
VLFLFVVAFGIKGHMLVEPFGYDLKFWHYWEVGALVSTCVFNTFFYILGFFFPPKMFLHLKDGRYIGILVFLELISSFFLGVATWVSLNEKNCLYQLFAIVVVSLCLWAIDWVMSRQSRNKKIREDFQASSILNDMPSFFAFTVLFIFTLVFYMSRRDFDPAFRAFIGGAIAFQMIFSNFVLVLILRKPGEWREDEDD